MTVTVDGIAHAGTAGSATAAPSLTTVNAGDAVVAFIVWGFGGASNASKVNSISSANTTGWTKRAAINNTPTAGTTSDPTTYTEIWSGLAAAALTNEVITVTLDHIADNIEAVMFGVHSTVATYTKPPFDVNPSLPAKQISRSPSNASPGPNVIPSVAGVSTFSTAGLLLSLWGSVNSPSVQQTKPAGFADIDNHNESAGTLWANEYTASQTYSSAQSSATFTWTNTVGTTTEWVAIIDALIDGPGASPAVRRRPTQVSLNRR